MEIIGHTLTADSNGLWWFPTSLGQRTTRTCRRTPPSGEKLSSLEKAAERGAAEATRPDITDSLAISLSVVQHDLSGTDNSRAPN